MVSDGGQQKTKYSLAPHIALRFSSISKDFNIFPNYFRRASTNPRRCLVCQNNLKDPMISESWSNKLRSFPSMPEDPTPLPMMFDDGQRVPGFPMHFQWSTPQVDFQMLSTDFPNISFAQNQTRARKMIPYAVDFDAKTSSGRRVRAYDHCGEAYALLRCNSARLALRIACHRTFPG